MTSVTSALTTITSKAQAQYLKELKEKLPEQEEDIVLMDFAENYSVCQVAAQGFHCDTSQVTLHPVVVNYKNDSTSDGSLNCKRFCVISCVVAGHRTWRNQLGCFIELKYSSFKFISSIIFCT